MGRSRPAGGALTDPTYWDDYWRDLELPADVTPGVHTAIDPILEVIDRFVASDSPLSVLEIGGAPGRFLAHIWRRFGHRVCLLDSSPVGIEVARRNFNLLGVPGEVIGGDFLVSYGAAPQFDVVLSLGLIEHFGDAQSAVAAHLRYLSPGGTLIVGCPNYQGVNLALARRFSPSSLRGHNVDATRIDVWQRFERELGLEVRFRGYIGGFQPAMFGRCDRTSAVHRAVGRAFALAGRGMDRLNRRTGGRVSTLMNRWNSPRWSHYVLGVYRKGSS